jgi:hypothetical protein
MVEEVAMPLLQIFTIMVCPLQKSYLNLKTIKKLRIYNNLILIKKLENHKKDNKIKVVTNRKSNVIFFYFNYRIFSFESLILLKFFIYNF